MATTYSIPGDTEWPVTLLAQVMKESHPELAEAGVVVGILMASNPAGPAVKHGGYAASATIKVVSLRDRVRKDIDAEMTIDQEVWASLSREQQAALLDHELSHLKLVTDPNSETNEVKRDDLGRPRLRTVKADYNCGDAFACVVERHGPDAIEFESMRRFKAFIEGALKGS
jgi:hypothetical protein